MTTPGLVVLPMCTTVARRFSNYFRPFGTARRTSTYVPDGDGDGERERDREGGEIEREREGRVGERERERERSG